MGSWAIRGTRLHYNQSFSHTASQELLLNIVRMRYGEVPTFLDLPNINSVMEAKVDGSGGQLGDNLTQGVFGGLFGLRDEPTLAYQPRSGDNLAESLIQALTAEILLDVPPGGDTRTFLLAFVDSINGVRNCPTATSLSSRVLQPNDDYRYAVDLVIGLQSRGAIKVRVGKQEEQAHDAIPVAAATGEDVVLAAKEGFVYDVFDERVRLVERKRFVALAIQPHELQAADLEEVVRLFHLEPGRSAYRIESQENVEVDLGSDEAIVGASQAATDVITLNVRSGYQVLAFLSKGVDVPEPHVRRGTVHLFQGLDGRSFDGRQLTRGLFQVCVQKHRPLRSDLAVHYRGYWFYIPESDVQSRATLNQVKMAIDLQSQAGNAGPVLTLPLR
ncbi:MAG: hypothetical protein ACKO1M_03545 [Planctomycetota bacterium]